MIFFLDAFFDKRNGVNDTEYSTYDGQNEV